MTVRGGAPAGGRLRANFPPPPPLPPSRTRAGGDGFALRVEGAPQERGVVRLDDPAINEKTAIAVFGKASEGIDFRDRQPRGLERLDERIGEPLAEFVKRHELLARHRWMAAAIAERNAIQADAPGPDRPEDLQQGAQDFRGRQLLAPGRPVMVEVPWPRRSTEQGGVGGANLAQPTQQGRTAFDPGELGAY